MNVQVRAGAGKGPKRMHNKSAGQLAFVDCEGQPICADPTRPNNPTKLSMVSFD